MSASSNLRPKVVQLYKTLLHLGKDYPKGYDYFRTKVKNAFLKNKDMKDPDDIEVKIARGQYVVKELEALYMLRKYRTLKSRYYNRVILTHILQLFKQNPDFCCYFIKENLPINFVAKRVQKNGCQA